MARTYRAILRDGRIEWIDPPPKRNQPTHVHITVPDVETGYKKAPGKAMAVILKKLVDRGGVSSINDPAEWQRELRDDGRLLGRLEDSFPNANEAMVGL